jgi:hypothetical protein
MMCNHPFDYRTSSLFLRSVFRLASLFCRPLVVLSLAVVTLGLLGPAAIAQNIFNCTSFTTSSGPCSISFQGSSQTMSFFSPDPSSVTGGVIDLVPTGSTHNGYAMWYQKAVNVQAFSSTFTFVPSGYDNLAFVIQNEDNNGNKFTYGGGAGPEGGFSQFATGGNIPTTNVFALDFDQWSSLTDSGPFTYSSAQIYQTFQMPELPLCCSGYLPMYATNKISTSPVPLNSPPSAQFTTTGDTYSATVTYDGYTFTVSLYDVTAGGSCPGASCFTHSWSGVYIPEIVGSTTAVVGLTNGVSITSTNPLDVKSFSYTVNAPTGTPSYTAWNANSTYNTGTVSAASPVYSVAPGTYSGTQSVSITSSTPNDYICYVLSATTPTLYPQPNNDGGCVTGTLYTGPVSISSTATLYAMAGSNVSAFSDGLQNPTGLGPPSTLVAGTYSIGGTGAGSASTPAFSPGAGAYTGTQSVTISDATSDATIYYTTNGTTPTTSSTEYTGPITVNSTETLKAIAAITGDPSTVASATYTIGGTGAGSASTPTFSPGTGTYTGTQSVTISDATSDATIYYTTNGTTPTTSSTEYTGPITVSSTETLQAIAVATGATKSAVASATYTVDSPSSGSGNPPVINYPSGFAGNPSQLSLKNSAIYSGSSIQLTNSNFNLANNVWFKTPVDVQAFTTTFTWNAICPAEPAQCGDGMGFMIISNSNPSSAGSNYSGSSGMQLSWSRCNNGSCPPINSALVKFDLYNNATGATGANLTGFYSGGVNPQPPQPDYDMAPAGINIESGHLMKATLTYNGTALVETVTDTVTGATYTKSYSANIPALVGGNTALVGFGGSTGGASVTQNIRSWTYTVESPGN